MTETDADASPGERTQPLTFGQRARLLSNCWPFVAVLALKGAAGLEVSVIASASA